MEAATFRMWTEVAEPTTQFALKRNHDSPHRLSSVVKSATSRPIIKKKCGPSGHKHFLVSSAINASPLWVPSTLVPMCAYLRSCFGACSGISFMDSTSLKVCHNRRIGQHKVFKDLAARGKTSVDWFRGFKLHLVVNDARRAAQYHAHSGQY